MSFHVGQTFGDYSITALLGAGGIGQVYRVEHSLTNRTETMKVLAELASENSIKRFEREMRALAKLSHPNIAALHNALQSENQLILLMEYIEGQTLESMFHAGRLPLETGVGYIKQMLSALGYAHQQGVVHRDVTPANVLITAASEVKLTDFGLSKSYGDPLLTTCGEVLGSLPYLAPEQLKGTTQPDRRSDLYSVGAILYEHLTGQKPFGSNRRLAPVLTDSEDEPKPPSQIEPSLSPRWDEILRRALARDPAHRYQSAEEFLDAIAHPIKPAAADLPLPQLRTLGIGIGAVVILALAFVASPAYSRFRQVAPVTTEVHRLHIAPPAFATAMTPHGAPARVDTTRRVAAHAVVKPAKRTARSVPASVAEPRPAVEALKQPQATAPTALTVPAGVPASNALTTPTARSAPAGSIPSAETQSAPASAGQEANQPVASEAGESGVSPAPTPAKKHFWNKLNVFKKKKPEPNEGQQ
jgi:hypothetical protein